MCQIGKATKNALGAIQIITDILGGVLIRQYIMQRSLETRINWRTLFTQKGYIVLIIYKNWLTGFKVSVSASLSEFSVIFGHRNLTCLFASFITNFKAFGSTFRVMFKSKIRTIFLSNPFLSLELKLFLKSKFPMTSYYLKGSFLEKLKKMLSLVIRHFTYFWLFKYNEIAEN